MATPTIVDVQGLSKRFVLHKDKSIKERLVNFSNSRANREDFWALRGIDLKIETGTTVGLVGHNGSGKSTLLKIIGGIIEPSSGQVLRRGRLAALLELGAGFHPDLTGRENVYLNASILGLSRAETDRHFAAIVDFSGIEDFIDTQVKFYSSGMYVRLGFSVAVHLDPDLLLVDEVLAVGDEPFQRKCVDKIAEFQREGRTIILVTHSSQQIMAMCDRVAVLNHGRMIHDGDPIEGLRALRESYDTPDGLVVHGGGGAAVSISDVRLTASARELSGQISAGADLNIEVDHHVTDPMAGWLAGIDIQNALGQSVYGVNTAGLGLTMPVDAGDYTLKIALPQSALGSGRHLLYSTVVTENGDPIDATTNPVDFTVVQDLRGVGYLQFDARGTVIPRS
jgi:ABC-2 type transport system ATP-binding protein